MNLRSSTINEKVGHERPDITRFNAYKISRVNKSIGMAKTLQTS
jgi:hypothetical protein